jgi:two-component system, OmpR family, sensor histidine kinase CreC
VKLGLRLLLGFFVITGIAAFFVLRVFVMEVRPSVSEVMEDMLVDTANILAVLARAELRQLPEGGTLSDSAFAVAVRDYASRPVDAQIWGLTKQTLDYRVYVTDAKGRVVFDSGEPRGTSAVGQDYSRWRDVYLTLNGRYGARASREVQNDEGSSVMYVAAPVRDGARTIGVLTVAKPMRTVQKFVDRAEQKILVQGAWLMGLSLAVGLLVTGWVVWSVRRLRVFAQQVQLGERLSAPKLSGELGELAGAMEAMRERLDGRQQLEQTVRALTHELKSPMAAIAGAAELLHDDLPAADRERFAAQIQDQVQRQRVLVERLLELSKLEHRRALDHTALVDLTACMASVMAQAAPRAQQRQLRVHWHEPQNPGNACQVHGDRELLALALANVFENAIDFSPRGGGITVRLQRQGTQAVLSVRDEGPGVEPQLLPKLGERFFSVPRPAADGCDARKGSGLGLAIVREVMALHHGQLRIANADPGLRVELLLTAA